VAGTGDQEIARLNRLYFALTQISQAIVRKRSREELLERVCQILVNDGGFRLAWVGWLEPVTQLLVPVSQAGPGVDYLKGISVYADDRLEGQGPTGRAFRDARPYICNDLTEDPATLPWRAKLEQHGMRASAALPIHVGGVVQGTLNVYADRVGYFQDKELSLLAEAAADLSFALDNLVRDEERRQTWAERRRAEEALARSEQRYRSTLDNILEGCQLLDFEWRYLYLNDAAAKQNRRPNAELLGQRMPDMWPGIEATPVFALLRRCMEDRVALHEETEFTFADGSRGWFDVRSQPVPEGIFVLSIDISERKQVERVVRELNESLEAKVHQRTVDLEAARARAEAADRLKSAFLATMSHELRTPLNSIIGFTGIVLQGLAGPLTAEQRKQLGMVRGSARHLLELINDVLDLSKIEADQLEVVAEPFELPASIERVLGSVRPQADRKALKLEARVAPGLGQMVSDRRRVEQIMLNLVGNALKFTDHGGVTVSAERLDAWPAPPPLVACPALRLWVEDTGIGIKPDDLATLFQPFRQVDTGLARQHQGTGLGLAICRRLATLLGGDITATSEWGKGSRFTLTLPLERPTA